MCEVKPLPGVLLLHRLYRHPPSRTSLTSTTVQIGDLDPSSNHRKEDSPTKRSGGQDQDQDQDRDGWIRPPSSPSCSELLPPCTRWNCWAHGTTFTVPIACTMIVFAAPPSIPAASSLKTSSSTAAAAAREAAVSLAPEA